MWTTIQTLRSFYLTVGCLLLVLDGKVDAGVTEPVIFQNLEPVLVSLGQSATLAPVQSVAAGQVSYTWLKERRRLTGASAATYAIPTATAISSGTYHLEVTLGSRKFLSPAILVGVYEKDEGEISLQRYQPASFTTRAWGPGIRVVWSVDETWAVNGTKSSTLRARYAGGLEAALTGNPLISDVILGSSYATAFAKRINLRYAPQLEVSPLPSTLVLGEPFEANASSPPDFDLQCEGLPPGLICDSQNKRISGSPTQAGHYIVTMRGSNEGGTSDPIQWAVTVGVPPITDIQQASEFWGQSIVETSPGREQVLTIFVKTEKSSRCTGYVILGAQRKGFVSRWVPDPNGDGRSLNVSLGNLSGALNFRLESFHSRSDQDINTLKAYATCSWFYPLNLNEFQGVVSPTIELLPRIKPTAEDKLRLSGKYTSHLLPSYPDDSALPNGYGIMSLTFPSSNQAVGIGTLADGEGFTFSAPLLRSGMVVVFGCSHLSKTNLLFGQIGYDVWPSAKPKISGSLQWTRKPQPQSRLYPEGFRNIEISVDGGRYFVPKDDTIFYSSVASQLGRTQLTLGDGDLFTPRSAGPLVLQGAYVNNRLVFPPSKDTRLKLDFFFSTGFFTGELTLNDTIPPLERAQSRKVFIRGMIVRGSSRNSGSWIGGGFFLLPGLPHSSSESSLTPIRSGKLELMAY